VVRNLSGSGISMDLYVICRLIFFSAASVVIECTDVATFKFVCVKTEVNLKMATSVRSIKTLATHLFVYDNI